MSDGFNGRWVQRRGVRVPLVEPEPVRVTCKVCGVPSPVGLCRPCRDSSRTRVHGSHAGHAQHVRRNERPCKACSDAEKLYQDGRYRKGQLSAVDRDWAERHAVKHSWLVAERANRR